MPATNPATTARGTAAADERIPGLPALPVGTARATLSIPVYDPATDGTYQTELLPGDGTVDSNAVVGGPKLVQFLDSRLAGVAAGDLTLDRLIPETIVPGTTAYVDNPSPTPTTAIALPKTYVATTVAVGTAGAVLVPRYIGAAVGDTVPIVWSQVVVSSASSVVLDPGTVLHFDNILTLHGEVATGSFTVDTSAMMAGAEESIVLGSGATLPTTADTTTGGVTTPATLDPAIFHTTSAAPTAGKKWEYIFRVGYDGQHVEYLVTDITP
ncbi:MAG: hypothetical protein ACRYFX_12950 [Janthinobacterium lividum]